MSIINTVLNIIRHPFNRSNKLSAIFRFIKWQIGSRLVPGEVIYEWINGSKIIARTGETGVTGNIYCGLHESSDMAFLLHVLRSDDLFVDVGANVGSYTVLSSAVVGAKSYCFEPVPSTFNRLRSNIRINGMNDKVICSNVALGSEKGKIYFSSDQNCMNHVIADHEVVENKIEVPVSTMDEEIEGVPFLMKIDVEGYETPALEGAKALLSKEGVCAIIMELNGAGARYGYNESKILELMAEFGFNTYSYDPFKRKLESLNGKNVSEGNTICIRNFGGVLERIKSAPKFHINGLSI